MRKKDKLYTVNKWNRPVFMPEKNLFYDGGNSRADYANDMLYGASQQSGSPSFGFNTKLSQPKLPPINWGDSMQNKTATSITGALVDTFGNKARTFADNFGKSSFSQPTLFTNNNGPTVNSTDAGSFFGKDLSLNSEGASDSAKAVKSGFKGAAMQAAGATALNALSTIDTGERNGIFDTLDPVYHLAGGRESKVGNALSDTGVSLTKSGNPWLMLAGAGLKIIGGLTNAAFGLKENKELKQAADASIKSNSSFISNADSFDGIKGPVSKTGTNIYDNGWFTSEADEKNAEYNQMMNDAYSWADRSVLNNIYNLSHDQIADFERNYSAFGGPIDVMNNNDMGAIEYGFMSDYLTNKKRQQDIKDKMVGITPMPTMNAFANGGGIHIKHPGRLTALKKRTGKTEAELYNDGNPAHKKMVVFARNARKWKHADGGPMNTLYQEDTPLFAFGGDLQTNISDFSTGLTHVNAGGSHEESPYDGVQMGVDSEGTPNLVEENETVWNDYVFSNRIIADEETKKKLHLPKKAELTYADISKKLEKEIAERPADPISEAGFKAQMQALQEQQERQKAEMEAARAREAFEALSPEEQVAVMDSAAQQDAMAQEAAQQQAIAEQQAAMQQPSPEEAAMMQQQMMQADGSQAMLGQEPQMAACGGKINKYAEGGYKKNAGSWKKGTSSDNWLAYTKNGLRDYLLKVNDEIAEADTEDKKRKIREEAIRTVNNIQKAYSEAYQSELSPSERNEKVEALQKAFEAAGGNAYFGGIANNINLPKGHNTADAEEKGWVDGYWGPRTSIRNWGSTEYGDTDYYSDLAELAREAGLTYAPGEYRYGNNTLYQLGMAPEETGIEGIEPENAMDYGDLTPAGAVNTTPVNTGTPVEQKDQTEEKKKPGYKAEWPRYAGLFGPAVGLGLMAAGVGRPDTSGIDAAVNAGRGPAVLADWKPIGDYMTYKPNDPWFYTAPIIAQSNATQRSINNTTAPSRNAASIANAYNTMIALGKAQREQLDSNYGRYAQKKEFNRGTNQFNAQAYNQNQQFNADAQNRARQYSAQLALQGSNAKMDADAGWYNGLYGNIAGLFKGLSDMGRENTMFNWIARNGADGIYGNLGESETGKLVYGDRKSKRSKGGNIKRKKGLTY